jgi:hypothetical protein
MKKNKKQKIPSFEFTIDLKTGERVYKDPNVQLVYINLGRLSQFINRSQDKSELEYSYLCQNILASGDTNTKLDFLCNLLVDAFGFMGDVEFPWAGKAGGKIAGWLLSALVDTWRSEPPQSLQNDFNNVWNGTKQAFDEAQLAVDEWRENLNADIWTKQHIVPKSKGTVTVSQLADVGYLPDPEGDTEFDDGAIAISKQTDYMMCSILVPSKWRYSNDGNDDWWDCYYTRWNDSYPYDGPFYDGLSIQTLFGIRTSFPDIDVVEASENQNHYKYFSTSDTEEYNHNWFSNDTLYKGTKYTEWSILDKDNGGTAPDSFISFLFKDGPGGSPEFGIANRDDVFNNWGMK